MATGELEQQVEADDGVVEVPRVLPHLTFPWSVLPPGPRRWAPTDLSVEVAEEQLTLVRMTYRTIADRVVIVAAAPSGGDVDVIAEQLATPLLFAHFRRQGGAMPPAAILAALRDEPVWGDDITPEGWRLGRIGVGDRPVRLAHRTGDLGDEVIAAHGVVVDEAAALLRTLAPLMGDAEGAGALHKRHRAALAQRWWDAPRVPWTPEDRPGG